MAAIALMAVASYAASAAGIAGTIGASLLTGAASLVGGMIDRALFGGGKGPTIEGPRMTDGQVTGAAYGAAIPLAFGTVRMSGTVIWDGGLVETRHEKRVKGGKGFGGGKSSTQVSYTYSRSFMVAFCEGPVTAVRRIWGDNKLFYDDGDQQACAAVRVYLGTETQSPDSLIQSVEGVANTPAYRGICCVMFEGMQLADFANHPLPNIEAEVEVNTAETVATVIEALVGRTNLADYDVTPCTGLPVAGYRITSPMDARAAIEALLPVYNVLGCTQRDGLLFTPRGTMALLGIDEEVIGVAPDRQSQEEAVRIVRADEIEPPRQLWITHLDPARDYQPNTQYAERLIGNAYGRPTVELPFVLTADEAKQLAERYLYDAWSRRSSVEDLVLPPAFQFLEPGQLVDIKLLGKFERLRIRGLKIGANGIVMISGGFEDSAHLISSASGLSGVIPGQSAGEVPATIAYRLDIPILREEDDDWGWYLCVDSAAQALWRGMTMYRSLDGVAYDELAAIGDPGVTGTCDTTLANGPWHFLDTASTLDVTLASTEDQLYSVSAAELLAYKNFCAVGTEAAGWEILQFRDATLLAPGQYRLSNLLRGRRGTDWKVGAHVSAEKFILLEDGRGMERIPDAQSLVGLQRTYKAVSVNQSLAAVTGVTFTNTGVGKKPLAPAFVRGTKQTSGDIAISWLNRSRIPNDWPNGQDVPLGEETERYQVEVYDGVTLKRTTTVAAAKTWTYTLAAQVADFGVAQASYAIKVAQLTGSGLAGYQRAATVPTSFAAQGLNYVAWDPNDKAPNHTLSGNNLIVTSTSTTAGYTTALNGQRSQGKYYVEYEVLAIGTGSGVGQAFGLTNALAANNQAPSVGSGWDNKAAGDGNLYEEATDWGDINAGPTAWIVGDVISMAWDADADLVWFRINGGSWDNNGSHDPPTLVGGRSTTTGGNPLYLCFDHTKNGASGRANFGASTFLYAVPAGFKAGIRSDEVGRTWSMWSGSDKTANLTVSQGNQRGQVAAAAFNGARSDMGRSSGKLYAEWVINSQGANFGVGVADAVASLSAQLGSGATSVAYRPDGTIVRNGATQATGSTYANADVVSIALDVGARLVWFRKNGGNWNGSGTANPEGGIEGIDLTALASTLYLAIVSDTSGHAATVNTGAAEWRYTPPTGFTGIYT